MGGQASEGVKGARANYIRIVLVNREMRKQGTVTLVLTNNVDGLAAAYMSEAFPVDGGENQK